jgi:prophage antirepressor-like protein
MSGKDQGEGDNVVGLPTEFRFEENQVRVIMKDGDAWFVAKDVCEVLEHTDPSMAVSRLDDDEKDTSNVGTPGGPQDMLTVSEWAYTLSCSPAGSRRRSASANG